MADELSEVMAAIRGSGRAPLFLPDLTLWFDWHEERGTLPARWGGKDLPGVCRELGVAPWAPVKPWKVALDGVGVRKSEEEDQRTVLWETPAGTLRSRWTRGPDDDWWHEEYPVKSAADLEAAMAVVRGRRYVPEAGRGGADASVIELPHRPFSEIFHTFLGWSEGLMLFLEEPEIISDMIAVLETSLADLEERLVRQFPAPLFLAPDNLDAQFMAPASFDEHLAPSYRRTAGLIHASERLLVVHGGGPLRSLLPGLAACGVDCVQGICGAPQSDASLAEARAIVGPLMALWGGIPQDCLQPATDAATFRAAAAAAFADALRDPRAIVGVSDKVPVEAVPERLEELARMAGD